MSLILRYKCFVFMHKLPHRGVLGHCLGEGLVSGLQLEVEQLTAPAIPDSPDSNPHLLVHWIGSCCNHSPDWGGRELI